MEVFFWVALVLVISVMLIELVSSYFERLVRDFTDDDEEAKPFYHFPGTIYLLSLIFYRDGLILTGIITVALLIAFFHLIDSVILGFVTLWLLFLTVKHRVVIARSSATFVVIAVWFTCLLVAPEE